VTQFSPIKPVAVMGDHIERIQKFRDNSLGVGRDSEMKNPEIDAAMDALTG